MVTNYESTLPNQRKNRCRIFPGIGFFQCDDHNGVESLRYEVDLLVIERVEDWLEVFVSAKLRKADFFQNLFGFINSVS